MEESHTSDFVARKEARPNWSDVIESSKQIAAEPIQTYQLSMDKEDLSEDGRVKTCSFGQKDPVKKRRTIIMLGETRTGKSTLINMMINYVLGVKWEDNIRFVIIPDEGKTEPRTTAVTAYEIYGLESLSVPFSLTVIDTPGFGDTDGPEEDEITVQNLYKLLKSFSGFDQIDAVCLVVKAPQNRQSPRQKYIFDTVLSLFGKNLEKNIMALFTFSDWLPPSGALEAVAQFGVPLAKEEFGEPFHFLFNNHPFQKPAEIYEETYKRDWDNGMENLSEFLQALNKMETQSFRMTRKVLSVRQSLAAQIQSLESQIKDLQRRHEALEEELKTLEECAGENSNFENDCKNVVMRKVNLKNPVTVCTMCEVTCSIIYEWSFLCLQWGAKHFECPAKCGDYIETKEIYVQVNEQKTGTQEEQKTAEEKVSKLQEDLNEVDAEQTKLMELCYQSVLQLEKLALKFLSDSTCQNILKLIEILKKKNKTAEVEKLQKMLEDANSDRNEGEKAVDEAGE